MKTAAAVALLASALPAQQGFEQVLPADTLAFIGVADVERMSQDFRESASGRYWYDPANAGLREVLAGRIDVLTQQMHAELGVDPLDLLDMLHGRVALAAFGTPAESAYASGGPPPGLGGVLLADVGEDREQALRVVDALVGRLAERSGAVRKSFLAGEVEVSVLEFVEEGRDGSVRLNHCLAGDTLVLALEVHPLPGEPLEGLLERLSGGHGDVLADRPAFRDSLASRAGGLQGWVDLGRLLGFVRLGMEANGEADDAGMLERLGLFGLGCLALNSRYAEGESRLDMHVAWDGGWIPDFARLALVSGPADALGVVPQDCLSAVAARVDFAGLFDAGVKALLDAGQVTTAEVTDFLAQSEEQLGFNLRDDLLDALDGRVTFVTGRVDAAESMPGTVGEPQNFVVVLGLEDGERINTLVEDVVRSTGLHAARQREEFQGFEVFSVPVFPGVEIRYAILPDMAVLSLSPTLLHDVLRRRAGSDLPVLTGDDDFQARSAHLSGQPGLLQYTNTAESIKGAYAALAGLAEMLREADPSDFGPAAGLFDLFLEIPPADEALIERHFHGATLLALSADEGGLTVQSLSP